MSGKIFQSIIESEMNDSIGKNIKIRAKNEFSRIFGKFLVIAAFVFIASSYVYLETEDGIWLLGIAGAIYCIAVGFDQGKLQAAKLYAYGELVDNSVAIKNMLMKNPPAAQGATGDQAGDNKIPAWKRVEMEKAAKQTQNIQKPWKCPYCEHMNPSNGVYCESCGCSR